MKVDGNRRSKQWNMGTDTGDIRQTNHSLRAGVTVKTMLVVEGKIFCV